MHAIEQSRPWMDSAAVSASSTVLALRQPAQGPGRGPGQPRPRPPACRQPPFSTAVNNVLADLAAQVVEPLPDAAHQLRRIEHGKHTAKCVVRSDPAFEPQKRPQPIQPIVAEPLDVDPPVGARKGAVQRHDRQLEQIMHARPLDPRIGQIFKRCKNCNQAS